MISMLEEKSLKFKRLKRVALIAALFIVCGILYAIIVRCIGFGIPCIFYEITGLKCGGCGITRGLIALLHFDFGTMIQYNAFLPFILVYVLLAAVNSSRQYILMGKFRLSAGKTGIDIAFLVLLVIWCIIRLIFNI